MFLPQVAEPTITLTRIAAAPALVAELAKVSGRQLEVSPTLNREILMVSVENAKINDILTKLALAVTATWEPMENGLRLVPDRANRATELAAERARRRQGIEASLRKKAEAARAKPKADPTGAEIAGMFMGGSNAVDAFVPMLDLTALAALEDGDRIVFATSPTPMQRPLRGNPAPIIANIIARHNQQAKEMAGSMGEMPEGMEAMMKSPIGDRFRKMSKVIIGNPSKIAVAVSKGALGMFGGNGLNLRVEVRAYGPDGSLLIEETGSIDSDPMAMLVALQEKPAASAPGPATPIAYSEEAKQLAESSSIRNIQAGIGVGERAAIPAKLKAYLSDPVHRDPLALVPGEGLAALAKARRKPLVADLPDAAFTRVLGEPTPKTVEDVEKSLKTGPMRLVADADFLVVKAADPDLARRDRVDRTALASLIQAALDHDSPTLDELSAYALRAPEPMRNAVSMTVLGLFVPTVMGSMAGPLNWDALRLFGTLTPAQRDTLAKGGRVPFSTVTPEGRTALAAMLYGSTSTLTVARNGVVPEDDIFSMGMRMWMGGGGTDIQDEPTQVAPNGLASGYLAAFVTNDPIIRPSGAQGASPTALGSDELAMVRLIATGPLASQVGNALKLPETGVMGSRTVWNLRGYVQPTVFVSSSLREDRTPKNGRTVSMTDLPSDLQSKVAEKTEKLKKSPLGSILAMAALGQPKAKP